MAELDRLVDRVDELESRLAFQDDLLGTLNDQIAHQQQSILALQEQLRQHKEQLKTLGEPQMRKLSEEVPPPHY